MVVQPNASILVHFDTGAAMTQHAQILHCDLQCRMHCEPVDLCSLVLQAGRRCTATCNVQQSVTSQPGQQGTPCRTGLQIMRQVLKSRANSFLSLPSGQPAGSGEG